MGIVFSPYGNSKEFYEKEYTSLDAPKYLSSLGLEGTTGFPGGASGKELACQCRRQKRRGFNAWVRKIP